MFIHDFYTEHVCDGADRQNDTSFLTVRRSDTLLQQYTALATTDFDRNLVYILRLRWLL